MIRQKVNKQKGLINLVVVIVIFAVIGYILATKVFRINLNFTSGSMVIVDVKKDAEVQVKYSNLQSISNDLFKRDEVKNFVDYSKNIKKRDLNKGNKTPFIEKEQK